MNIYQLKTIEYEDDYKHRYDSGVYINTYLFSTYEKAEKYFLKLAISKIIDKINETICEEDEYYDWFDEKDNTFILKDEHCNIEDIDLLINDLFTGQFVNMTFEYEINEIKIDNEYE